MYLNGWKQVASYLKIGVRTAQRWERLGLPARRLPGRDRGAVFAFSEELDRWMRNRSITAPPPVLGEIHQTFRKTKNLFSELVAVRSEHQQLIAQLREGARRLHD